MPYITFWLAIAIVFDALFLLSPNVDVLQAISAALQIIGTAALLGFGGLHLAFNSPMPQDDKVKCLVIHAVGAFVYTLSWIVMVSFVGGIGTLITSGEFIFKFPGGAAFRWHLIAGPVLYTAIVTAIFSVRSFERSQNIIKEVELQALRAKLNPHFLFNTLHSIMMLFRIDADKAEKATEQFSDLIRYSFHGENTSSNSDAVFLSDEWKITEKYLELEKLRLAEKLNLNADVDKKALEFISPKLLLQPLIENAVVHGADENGVDIGLHINFYNDRISIIVQNEFKEQNVGKSSSGLGLNAVKAGLENTFGSNASLDIKKSGDLFIVKIDMPAQKA